MMLNPSVGLPDDRKSLYPQSQSSAYKCGDKTSPISVILVSSGSRGNKLLFRYPYQKVAECPSSLSAKQRNPYVLNTSGDELDDQDGDSRYFYNLHLLFFNVLFNLLFHSEIQMSFLSSLCFPPSCL